MLHPPVALSIAGSDCSAGAGIQADLKTFQHYQVHGLTAVTCVVSETSRSVAAIEAMPSDLITSQIILLLESFPVAAIKTGMLHSAEVIERVASQLAQYPRIPLVVDPVMVASSGASLMESNAIAAYKSCLFPLAAVITPNLPEAEVLLGREISCVEDMQQAAAELADQHHCAVLLKGGHLDGDTCHDILVADGKTHHFREPRIPVPESHGTGCTLSAAICAALAQGANLPQAIQSAKSFLGQCLRNAYQFPDQQAPGILCLNQGTCGMPKTCES